MEASPQLSIQFLGATGTVTGSKYLVRAGAKRVLIDCGLFEGLKQLRLRNWDAPPVDPREVDAVVLTHAHLDHSGYLPLFVKRGFAGPVFCSHATEDFCRILLPDSGYLQEEEAEYANRHGYSKHTPALPLYTLRDAERCLGSLTPVSYRTATDLGGGVRFTFLPAGHILGAAMILLEYGGTSVLFSGDLGRPADPVIVAPATVEQADYLVLESTYGDRLHEAVDPGTQLAAVINRTVGHGGSVIVPAFAVGRAQALLYYIHRLKEERAIRDIPVFLNSPMAADVTQLYRKYQGEHRLTPAECGAMCTTAHIVNTVEESKQLNTRTFPMVIVSASGMATGGRILHHLRAFAPDPRNTILFTGFQAAGTRGAAMLAGATEVKIHGQYVPVRARVEALPNLSAHADYAETLGWLRGFTRPPRQVFLTHGEPVAADALRHRIEEQLRWPCRVPDYLETCALPGA
jgi:metallo-beta-lactamase family protein